MSKEMLSYVPAGSAGACQQPGQQAADEAADALLQYIELERELGPELGMSLLDVPNMMMILAGIGPL